MILALILVVAALFLVLPFIAGMADAATDEARSNPMGYAPDELARLQYVDTDAVRGVSGKGRAA